MSKTLDVNCYKIIGLNNHYVLAERGKNIQQVTLDEKTYEVEINKPMTLDSTIENRVGFSDKVAIESIEKNGWYGFKIETTISTNP